MAPQVDGGGGIRVTVGNMPTPPFQDWKNQPTSVCKIPSAVLISKSALVDYVRGAKFVCPSPGCQLNSTGQDLFLVNANDDEVRMLNLAFANDLRQVFLQRERVRYLK